MTGREFDVLIKNGTVVDGTGAEAQRADVGIVDDRIAAIGSLGDGTAKQVIDAEGLLVMPGLIDLHGHSDLTLLMDNSGESKLTQGITTEVVGNCGLSAAPFHDDRPILGFSVQAAMASIGGRGWTDMASYLSVLSDAEPSYNVVPLVGYGAALRASRAAADSPADLQRLALAHIEEALDSGAAGVSLGLYYPPERDATTDDLKQVAEAVARHDRLLTVHLRDESAFSIGLDQAIEEVLAPARAAGAKLQVSHLKALGPGGWDRLERALELLVGAREDGLDVAADQYPYDAGELSLAHALALDPDQIEAGAPVDEERVHRQIALRGGAARLKIARSDERGELVGLDLEQAIAKLGLPLAEAIRVLIVEDHAVVASHSMREEDVLKIMQFPWVSIGSDGVGIPLSLLELLDNPHPRNFGCFTRYLSRYVRDEAVVSLGEGVRKATSAAAERVGIFDRGSLKVGNYADIAVIDYPNLRDTATYEQPAAFSEGVRFVFVNGVPVLENGRMTSRRGGRVLAQAA
jgi:N-acyl-D-amino-acid deacylase